MMTNEQVYEAVEKIVTTAEIASDEPVEPPLYTAVRFDTGLFSALRREAGTAAGLTRLLAEGHTVMEALVAEWGVTEQSMRWCCITAMLIRRLSRRRRTYGSAAGVVTAPIDDMNFQEVPIPLDLPAYEREAIASILEALSGKFGSDELDEESFDRLYRSVLFSGPLSRTAC